eukprot:jgi/Hompol1/7014/HPOL_005158-RA
MRKIGYQERDAETKELESEEQYSERMCGILSLYAAIIQTSAVPNNYGIAHGWTWLACIMNLKPRKITPLLLITFLEIAGNALLTKYKGQAKKLIRHIIDIVIPTISTNKKAIASTTRLGLWLEETVLKNGQIPVFLDSKLEP